MTDHLTIDHDQAAVNIEAFAREGRLVQSTWHERRGGDGGGVEIACLLGAIHPSINGVEKCPASLMPRWMARLTVRLFDGIPSARAFEFGLAYAERLHRWRVIDAPGWERVRHAFIGEVLGSAMADWSAKIPDPAPPLWAPIKAFYERLTTALLSGTATRSDYNALQNRAWELREQAGGVRSAASAQRRSAAAAEAAAAAVAAAAAEAEAVEAAAVAAAVPAEAAVEAAAAAEAAVAEARRASYARSFETLLRAIDAEIGDR
jgi:hypothetical protein